MQQRRRLNRSMWTATLAAAAVVAGSFLIAPRILGSDDGDRLEPVAAYTAGPQDVGDEYTRTEVSGLGKAPVGGTWSTSPASAFAVGNGTAELRTLAAGHEARATLTRVAVDNQQLRTTFALNALPTGRGVYIGLVTRRQANGDAYRTRAFVTPNGTVRLDVVQVTGNKERRVTNAVILNRPLQARQAMTLETYVTGSAATATNLKVRAWPTGSATPSWQITTVQADRDRITRPGNVGLWFYTSTRNASPKITVDHTLGWQLRPNASTTSPPSSTSPKPTPTRTSSSTKPPTTSPTKTSSPKPSKTATTPPTSPTKQPTKSPSPTKSPTTTPPAPTSYPGPSNTGVPAGTKLKVHNGDLRITTAGATYSGLDVRGFVLVRAKNVTIKNSIIRGGHATGNIGLVNSDASSPGFRIMNSELVPQYPSVWIDGIKGWNYTASGLNIHGTVDGAKVYGNGVSITQSWIHDTRQFASDPNQGGGPSHDDGVQVLSGSNTTIANNTIIGGSNAALQVTQGHGTVQGLKFSRNRVGGGACTLNITSDPLKNIGGIAVTSNRFLRTSEFKCPMIVDRQVQYQNGDNRYVDNNQIVSVVSRS